MLRKALNESPALRRRADSEVSGVHLAVEHVVQALVVYLSIQNKLSVQIYKTFESSGYHIYTACARSADAIYKGGTSSRYKPKKAVGCANASYRERQVCGVPACTSRGRRTCATRRWVADLKGALMP